MKLTAEIIRRVVDDHDKEWEQVAVQMRNLKDVYETSYWKSKASISTSLVIELSLGYEYIESYIASLYAREPAVIVAPDVRSRGTTEVAQLAANYWLINERSVIENATRLALIFPFAAIKLYPTDSRDVLRRVGVVAIEPWDIIRDRESDCWDDQRFVGHRYWVPVEEAKKKWGNRDYDATSKKQYLAQNEEDPTKSVVADDYGKYIQVVEVYDMANDRMYVWSPHYGNGEKWLFDGIKLTGYDEDGNETTTTFKQIPVRTADDDPRIPIVPVYMNTLPYDELAGYSSLSRVYDQIRERIITRTYQANAVRKAARQWFVRKDRLTADNMAALVEGIDGEFIEVEVMPTESLRDVAVPVEHVPTPPELESYNAEVQRDLDRGSILAPFTRGEATKASATEVTALAAYTASEVGRMARVRDGAIEEVASIYIDMLRVYLADEPQLITLDAKTITLGASDLEASFSFFAQDGGSTPIDRTVRRQELQAAVPVLQQLGVPNEKILAELVRVNDWPESFLPEVTPEGALAVQPPGVPGAASGGAGAAPATGLEPGMGPSPQRISNIVP